MLTDGASFSEGDDSALQISDDDDILIWLLLKLIFFSLSCSLPEHADRVQLLKIEMEVPRVILIAVVCVDLLEETAFLAVVVLLVFNPVCGACCIRTIFIFVIIVAIYSFLFVFFFLFLSLLPRAVCFLLIS
jgi:hypothetical protein